MTPVHYSSCHCLPDCLISFICSLFIFPFQKFFCLFLSPLLIFSSFFKKIFALLDQQCSRDHLNMGTILPGRAEAPEC